jgi:hypothetical protein
MAAPSHFGPPVFPSEPPSGAVAHPPEHWAPAPAVPPADRGRPRAAWAAIALAMLGVIVGAITVFAPWAEYVDGAELTGVEHGDGWIVLAIVAAASALVGAMASGARHRAIRYGLLLASVALFVVFALNRYDIGQSDDFVTRGPIDVGGGLYGVALAGCLVLAGALIIPPEPAAPRARG